MSSRKQRRRREKTFRHEYETVLLDGEGNEVALDPEELRAEREAKHKERAQATAGREKQKQKQKPARGARARPLREPPLPSWRRAVRRGGTMGALMLLAFLFILKSGPLPQRIGIGVFYGLAFIPLTF